MSRITFKRIKLKLARDIKHLRQDFFFKETKKKKIIFIVGCQRSGTTMLSKIFDKDKNVRVYPEKSRLTSKSAPEYLKFNPLDEVKQLLSKRGAPVLLMKPLVESQNTIALLDYFENSKAIWAFRNYKDVASSNLKKFNAENGINDLRPIAHLESNNWRAENVSEKTQQIVKTHFSENMSYADAAALFWYCRNVLFFEQQLEDNERVYLCKYEKLVTHPTDIMKQVYNFLGIGLPMKHILAGIHPGSISKGKNLNLSPEIEHLCESLLDKLNMVYSKN